MGHAARKFLVMMLVAMAGCSTATAQDETVIPRYYPYYVMGRPWRPTDRLPVIYDKDPLGIDRTSHGNRRLGYFDRQTYYLATTSRKDEWCFTQYNHRSTVTSGVCFDIRSKKGLAPTNGVLTPTGPGKRNLVVGIAVPTKYSVSTSGAHIWKSYRAKSLAVFIVSKSLKIKLRRPGYPTQVRNVQFDKGALHS